MTDHLTEARACVTSASQAPDAGGAISWLTATCAHILDHLEAQRVDPQQLAASIRRGLDDAAAGRTEYLGRFTDDEPEPGHGPRPAGCCGTCPPILGGGYDCTCADNPRCEANHTDRIDRYGNRWVWCDGCDGLRMDGHEAHGYGWSAVELDEACGPLTFAPRPADMPTTAGRTDHLEAQQTDEPEPEPDPLDEDNHADRYDGDGDRWVWCGECYGFRLGAWHEVHQSGYGWSAVELDKDYGPLTFAPRPAEPPARSEETQ